MGRTKEIKFQFFQMQLQKEIVSGNGQIEWKSVKVFDFPEWIASQIEVGNIKRNCNINDEFQGNLDSVKRNEINEDIYYARFYKLRDIVPAKVKDGLGAESIELKEDEYIGEDVCLLYDDNNGICMLQKNRFSLSHIKLSEWLSMSCKKGERVRLKPIRAIDINQKLLGKNVRSFDLSFANLQNGEEDYTLNSLIRTMHYFDGLTANIKIGVGKKRHQKLNAIAIQRLLQEIQLHKSGFSKAKVTLSDENDTNVEVLDLLDAVMSTTINFTIKDKEILDFNIAMKRMTEEYRKKSDELSQIRILPRR